MSQALLFLSHIHEEKDLAAIIKSAIENEFAGFVEVFVSSDGVSIPAGANFLKRIEDGLVNCIGALYLISPNSINRNWINFELGAIWIRNAISIRASEPEIPLLPLCHSGIAPSELPQPANNLNAIIASQSSQLEFAFRSIQSAVGGKGTLRTDFDSLAQEVIQFERKYTLIKSIGEVLRLLELNNEEFKSFCLQEPRHPIVTIAPSYVSAETIKALKIYESKLNGSFSIAVNAESGLAFNKETGETGQQATITLNRAAVIEAMSP
ncbi:toll/interleukin-1 receptor domain-containing protein [Pseudomonas sp. AN-1]|uniref:toll/interleukin-1 receptor domain-containing protein n=1 Tax=Pseudomonas sp. AN-1 TaxID=3096605 RepID=UPI002A6B7006|nr:toll/interleukin-1 receptor domain-containing protein [Pseudomonas sp. AN-1]WPP47051.1 toll/interleukin-1 receptor domain-containing protein [Pseudomonas sp. AN-1]